MLVVNHRAIDWTLIIEDGFAFSAFASYNPGPEWLRDHAGLAITIRLSKPFRVQGKKR